MEKSHDQPLFTIIILDFWLAACKIYNLDIVSLCASDYDSVSDSRSSENQSLSLTLNFNLTISGSKLCR